MTAKDKILLPILGISEVARPTVLASDSHKVLDALTANISPLFCGEEKKYAREGAILFSFSRAAVFDLDIPSR